jgi:hypothetical protein
MPNYFTEDMEYLAFGPDQNMTIVREKELAELLAEHGPERLTVYVQLWDGSIEELAEDTKHTGRDDLAKYYVTTYTSARTGLVASIGWDT